MHATSEYKALDEARAADQAKVNDLHGTPGTEAQIADLARDAMKQATAATKLENVALGLEGTALEARQKVVATGAAISKLRADFNASLRQTADWQAAKKAIDDAVKRLQTAEANAREESQKLASAQFAHNGAQAKKDQQDRLNFGRGGNKKPTPPETLKEN